MPYSSPLTPILPWITICSLHSAEKAQLWASLPHSWTSWGVRQAKRHLSPSSLAKIFTPSLSRCCSIWGSRAEGSCGAILTRTAGWQGHGTFLCPKQSMNPPSAHSFGQQQILAALHPVPPCSSEPDWMSDLQKCIWFIFISAVICICRWKSRGCLYYLKEGDMHG